MFGKRNKKSIVEENRIELSEEEIYTQIVSNYLKLSGEEVVKWEAAEKVAQKES